MKTLYNLSIVITIALVWLYKIVIFYLAILIIVGLFALVREVYNIGFVLFQIEVLKFKYKLKEINIKNNN